MFKKVPDAITIIGIILIIFIVLTWIIPAGEYERAEINGKTRVVPGTFEYVDPSPQSIFSLFTAPLKGFIGAAEIIGFVIFIGGAFAIVNATGAVNAGINQLIKFSTKYPEYKIAIIPLLMVFFSIGGCTFGMAEEVLVFLLITIPMAYALGYDSIVGVAVPFIGSGAGFAGAAFNPFTVGIAQGIAEVPIFSGWEYRLIVWGILTLIAIVFVMRYAIMIDKDPEKSLVKHIKKDKSHLVDEKADVAFTPVRAIILVAFLATLILLVIGVNVWSWYIIEIAALFIGFGLFSAVVYRLKPSETIKAFTEGTKDMVLVAVIIALSRGILVIAEEGKIIDTILNSIAGAAAGFPDYISVNMMLLVQTFINFFIPSGSGQAALTMPVMAPLSDLLGITRQTAVLAYQLGDGLTNLIIPTSGLTMGILAIARIPFDIWIKWIWKLMIVFYLTAIILLTLPTTVFEW